MKRSKMNFLFQVSQMCISITDTNKGGLCSIFAQNLMHQWDSRTIEFYGDCNENNLYLTNRFSHSAKIQINILS